MASTQQLVLRWITDDPRNAISVMIETVDAMGKGFHAEADEMTVAILDIALQTAEGFTGASNKLIALTAGLPAGVRNNLRDRIVSDLKVKNAEMLATYSDTDADSLSL